jgi:BolA protein
MALALEIEETLRLHFSPVFLKVEDDSARHAGHAGARAGGGHFRVIIVSNSFEGKSLLERHRRVKEALKDFFGMKIHALQLTTLTPDQWNSSTFKK